MKTDIIKINYKKLEEHKLQCYPPKSKYLLLKNILYFLSLTFLMLICNIGFWFLDNNFNGNCAFSIITLISCSVIAYDVYDEWKNGRCYKTALYIAENYLEGNEKEEVLKKLKQN